MQTFERRALLVLALAAVAVLTWAGSSRSVFLSSDSLVQAPPFKQQLSKHPGPPFDRYFDPDHHALGYDVSFQFLPWIYFLRDSRSFEDLWWNPHNFFGVPHLGNPQAEIFWPLTWLHRWLPLEITSWLVALLKISLFATGIYAVTRARFSTWVSLYVASTAAAGGLLHAWLQYPISSSLCLFGWIWWLVERHCKDKRSRAAPLLIFLWALTLLSGQPQIYILNIFLCMALVLLVYPDRRGLTTLGCMVAGILISAPAWLPVLEYARQSAAILAPRIARSGLPIHPRQLLTFIFPDFFGSPVYGTEWGFPGFQPSTAYFGAFNFVLVLGAAGTNQRLARAAWILLAATLLIWLGIAPFEYLLELPGLNQVRRTKLLWPVFFLALLLLPYGVEWARQHFDRFSKLLWALAASSLLAATAAGLAYRDIILEVVGWERHMRMVLTTSALLVAPWLAFLLWKKRGLPVACLAGVLLVWVPLANFSIRLNHTTPAELFELWRSDDFPRGARLQPGREHSHLFPPNSNIIGGVNDLRGYDAITPRRYFEYLSLVDSTWADELARFEQTGRANRPEDRLLVAAFRKALQDRDSPWRSYLAAAGYARTDINQIGRRDLFNAAVTGQGKPLPPAWIVTAWKGSRDLEQSIASLKENRRAAVPITVIEGERDQDGDANPTGSVRFESYGRSSAVLICQAHAGGYLLLSDLFYPGWKADVNGQREEIKAANVAFRAVKIPPGRSTVRFWYSPDSLKWGLAIAGLGLLASCMIVNQSSPSKPSRQLTER